MGKRPTRGALQDCTEEPALTVVEDLESWTLPSKAA